MMKPIATRHAFTALLVSLAVSLFTACSLSDRKNIDPNDDPNAAETGNLLELDPSPPNNSQLGAALIKAARAGNLADVERLLKAGANPNTQEDNGFTALIFAAWKGHQGVVKKLLADPHKRVEVNLKDKLGWTALMFAVWKGHQDVVKTLLADSRVEVNVKSRWGDDTALMIAAQEGKEAVVRVLLDDPRVKVNLKSKYGDTALSIAKRYCYQGVVEMLSGNLSHRPITEAADQKASAPAPVPLSASSEDTPKLHELATQLSELQAAIQKKEAAGEKDKSWKDLVVRCRALEDRLDQVEKHKALKEGKSNDWAKAYAAMVAGGTSPRTARKYANRKHS